LYWIWGMQEGMVVVVVVARTSVALGFRVMVTVVGI
jgi:hypothetical protein